ncbi:MAG: hypothetical protein ACXWXT_08900 [Candidatus Binatia bacterium]
MNCWNWVACPRWKIVNRLNRTYTLLLRSILNIKVTVGGDDGQIERTVPLAAPLRSRSVIVPRDGDMDYVSHFWKLLGLRSIEALKTIPPKIECFRYRDISAGRKKLAEDCDDRVLGRVTQTSLDQDEEPEDGGEPLLSR